MTTEPAGPRPGTETDAVIPGYRLAQMRVSSALQEQERITHALARERDAAVRELEESRREAGKLRARGERDQANELERLAVGLKLLDADPKDNPVTAALDVIAMARVDVKRLEELLREAVAEDDHIVLNERCKDWPLWRAREALGLDPRTGARDLREDVTA